MLFHSTIFIFGFLPAALLAYWWLSARGRIEASRRLLAVASLGFYMHWDPPMSWIFLVSLLLNYGLGRSIWAVTARAGRLALFMLGVLINLSFIAYYKYANLIADLVLATAGLTMPVTSSEIPLAISFFTFQQIGFLGYLLKSRPPRFPGALTYTLFISFFPQLIAGPIVSLTEVESQYARPPAFEWSRLQAGFALFFMGMAKKTLVSNPLGAWFNDGVAIIRDGYLPSFYEAWLTMTSGAFYIYFDYSAYADMALGLGLMFGILLPISFNSPYKATTPADFWRRWNVTLMRFLQNHVYIALGGSRKGLVRQIIALVATFVLCGIWHGSGYHYIAWGAVVGAIVACEILLRRAPRIMPLPPLMGLVVGRLMVFAAYVLPLVYFVFADISTGTRVIGAMLGFELFHLPAALGHVPGLGQIPFLQFDLVAAPLYFGMSQILVLALAAFIIYGLPNSIQMFRDYRFPLAPEAPTGGRLHRALVWRPGVAWGIFTGLLAATSLTVSQTAEVFFYFQF